MTIRPQPGGRSGSPIAVLVVEDHEMVGRSVAAALRVEGMVTALVAGSQGVRARALAALAALAAAEAAATSRLVLLDLDLGDGPPGEDLIGPLGEAGGQVIVLTGTDDPRRLATAVERGAVAIVSKAASFGALVEVLGRVARTGTGFGPGERQGWMAARRQLREERARRLSPFAELTAGEADVLRGLAQGRDLAEVARSRQARVGTVRSQVHAILSKVGVHTQQQAIALAWRSGWTIEVDGRTYRGDGDGSRPASRPLYEIADDGDRPFRDAVGRDREHGRAAGSVADPGARLGQASPGAAPIMSRRADSARPRSRNGGR